jgi:hypothetical protein
MHRPVYVAHSSFIEGSYITKNTAFGLSGNAQHRDNNILIERFVSESIFDILFYSQFVTLNFHFIIWNFCFINSLLCNEANQAYYFNQTFTVIWFNIVYYKLWLKSFVMFFSDKSVLLILGWDKILACLYYILGSVIS